MNDNNIRKKIFDSLNKNLLETQNVSKEQLDNLIDLYIEKDKIYRILQHLKLKDSEAEKLIIDNVDNNNFNILPNLFAQEEDIIRYTLLWTSIEFDIQENWNFKRDYNFHRFWENPYCHCPWLDNKDRWGLDEQVVAVNCPIHGNSEVMEKIRLIQDKKYDFDFGDSDTVKDFFKDLVDKD